MQVVVLRNPIGDVLLVESQLPPQKTTTTTTAGIIRRSKSISE